MGQSSHQPRFYTVLGVDPGHVNLGLSLVRREETPSAYIESLYVSMPELPKGPLRHIVDAIHLELLFMLDTYDKPDMVVIEEQYGYKQASIAHAIQGIFLGLGIDVGFVRPNLLPQCRENILKAYDMQLPDPPRRMSNRRSISKWLNVYMLDALCVFDDTSVKGIKREHMADAFIYAYNAVIEHVYECPGESE